MQKIVGFLNTHVIQLRGSTQTVACFRLGLVCLLWSRWALELTPFQLAYRGGTYEAALIGPFFFLTTTMLFLGLLTRLASIGVAICTLYIYFFLGFTVGIEPYTHHHTYVLTILSVLLVFLPAGRSLSLDRWLALRKSRRFGLALPDEEGPLWAFRLVSFQVSMIYFWSAYDKTNVAFLSGERMQHYFMYLYFGSDVPAIPMFESLMLLISAGAVLLEYTLAVTMWIPALRFWSILLALPFHGFLYYSLPVSTYTLSMYLCFMAFYPGFKLFPAESFLTAGELKGRT